MSLKPDDLSLYEYETCPYCQKVLQVIKELDLDIELRNIRENDSDRRELAEGGGKTQVPCLRINRNDEVEWMYESDDIIRFLRNSFS